MGALTAQFAHQLIVALGAQPGSGRQGQSSGDGPRQPDWDCDSGAVGNWGKRATRCTCDGPRGRGVRTMAAFPPLPAHQCS